MVEVLKKNIRFIESVWKQQPIERAEIKFLEPTLCNLGKILIYVKQDFG